MLRVLVIKKYYDNTTGNLIGYRVRNLDTNEEVDASKDAVKAMAIKGELDIVNMTLTSDGRLIGRAMNKLKQPKKPTGTGRKAVTVYTNGRKIACILVDEREFLRKTNTSDMSINKYSGIEVGFTFDVGFEATKHMASGEYDNIKMVDGKPVLADDIKKKSYKSVKEKLIKTLNTNDIHTDIIVEKGDKKYEYAIRITNFDSFSDKDTMTQILHILIENAMYNHKIKPLYIDEDTMYVSCLTGINDVRKALKEDGLHKL